LLMAVVAVRTPPEAGFSARAWAAALRNVWVFLDWSRLTNWTWPTMARMAPPRLLCRRPMPSLAFGKLTASLNSKAPGLPGRRAFSSGGNLVIHAKESLTGWGGCWEIRNPAKEIRNPKAEIRRKSECRNPK